MLKDAIAKNFVANEHHSFTFVFTFSVVVVVVVVDISSFLFPAETEVLVPVFSQSTDVLSKKSEGKSKVGTIYFPIHEVPTCLHSTPAGVNRRLGSPLHWKLWWQMCCSEGTSYFLHDSLVVLP